MKSPETAQRVKRFDVDEKARKVTDLEHMIRDFETMASDLDRQIQAEEEQTGIKDKAHFAYSTFAKSASQRRDNLRASVAELRTRLESAVRELEEANEQMTRSAVADSRPGRPHRRNERRAALSA
ncbi:MAG: flagellar export protein FliJ [Pseudomonadota bacterium]